MKRFLGTILTIIFFAACGENKPKGIFSEKRMTDILFDIHLADGYAAALYSDTLDKKEVNYYLSIYQKFQTDSAEVRRNLEYYAQHPQDLQDIYVEISKRLQSTEENLNKIESEKRLATFKLDSIKKQTTLDSLNLFKRDSVLSFNGKRDLFLHSKDSFEYSLTKKDSLSNSIVKDAVMNSVFNEQRRWEMTFYYFGESNLNQPLKPLSLNSKPENPEVILKKEENGKANSIKERILK